MIDLCDDIVFEDHVPVIRRNTSPALKEVCVLIY